MNVVRGSVKSKTIYLGLAVVVMGYIQAHKEALSPFIPNDWLGLGDMLLGAAIIVCRFFTNESLADKGAAPTEVEQ